MNIFNFFKKVTQKLRSNSIVLMYHRVADVEMDPWKLSVSPINFEEQLHILKKTGLVVPMGTLVDQLYSKKKSKPQVVISFDDGYEDNFLAAKPLLEKYQLPATFFVCTIHIGKNKGFWWDDLAYIFLHGQHLPSTLSISINGTQLFYDLKNENLLSEKLYQEHKRWDYTQTPPTRRSKIYLDLWKHFSPLTYQKQQHFLEEIKIWARLEVQKRKNNFSMSENQLVELANGEIFSIGAHSKSHPALDHHSEEVQYQEIAQNKQYLEAVTGLEVNSFAYPSGNFNETTVRILKQQGFSIGLTTNHQPVHQNDDPFRVGRFQVNNWTGAEFKQVLATW